MPNLLNLLNRQPKSLSAAVGFLGVIVVGIVDYLSGPWFGLSLFYLIPIAFNSWYLGKRAGILTAIISAYALFLAASAWNITHPNPFIPFWNAVLPLGIFMTVAWLIAALKELNEQLEEKVNERTAVLTAEIDERTRIEAALREREDFLSSIFSSIQDGISILDNEMRIIRVNPTMERWYAHAMPLVGRKCYEVYHSRKEPCEICPTKRTLETGASAHEIVPLAGLRGETVGWLDLYSFPLIAKMTGRQIGIIEYVRDISKHKEAELALMESEEKYRTLMDNASDGILIADKEGNLLESNKTARALFGYADEELKQMSFTQLHPKEEMGRVTAAFRSMWKKGSDALLDTLIARKDGSLLPADIHGGVITYADKKVLMGTFRDISERKRIEQMKDNLVRDVSHELKAPIAMMQMAFTMGEKAIAAKDIEEIKNAWKISSRNLRTLSTDVNNILGIFSLGAGGVLPQRTRISLSKMVAEIIKDLQDLIEQKKLRIKIDIPPMLDKIYADRRMIRTLIYNVLDNAIKFTRRGTVSITARTTEEEFYLEVNDTGRGIELRDKSALFTRFFKQDPVIQGTGLGLAICKEIADAYGGAIEVASAGAEKGTSVTVKLPRRSFYSVLRGKGDS